jgi:hypothetical protein
MDGMFNIGIALIPFNTAYTVTQKTAKMVLLQNVASRNVNVTVTKPS